MAITKHNHEFESKDGKRILDPVGKLTFKEEKGTAQIGGGVHTLDLEKSSNFKTVTISNYANATNYINFLNIDKIHRFDLDIRVQNQDHNSGNIYFGDGTDRYEEPQYDVGTLSPKLFWIHNNPYIDLSSIKTNIFQSGEINTDMFKTYGSVVVSINAKDHNGDPLGPGYGINGFLNLRENCEEVNTYVKAIYEPNTTTHLESFTGVTPAEYCLHFASISVMKDGLNVDTIKRYRFTQDNETASAFITFRTMPAGELSKHIIGYLSNVHIIPGSAQREANDIHIQIDLIIGQYNE